MPVGMKASAELQEYTTWKKRTEIKCQRLKQRKEAKGKAGIASFSIWLKLEENEGNTRSWSPSERRSSLHELLSGQVANVRSWLINAAVSRVDMTKPNNPKFTKKSTFLVGAILKQKTALMKVNSFMKIMKTEVIEFETSSSSVQTWLASSLAYEPS